MAKGFWFNWSGARLGHQYCAYNPGMMRIKPGLRNREADREKMLGTDPAWGKLKIPVQVSSPLPLPTEPPPVTSFCFQTLPVMGLPIEPFHGHWESFPVPFPTLKRASQTHNVHEVICLWMCPSPLAGPLVCSQCATLVTLMTSS